VAKHILKLDIDARLAQSVPELVNEIAVTPVKEGKTIRYYSFATKYCSWHVPDGYPIFDSIVAKLIGEYQRLDKFTEDFWQNELARDYVRFKRTIEAFREKYGLAEFGFRNLDKFLWLYGKEFLGKTT
jgi:hypothetical protein